MPDVLSTPTQAELAEAIERRFGSLEVPSYAFVAPAFDLHPFDLLIERLKAGGLFVHDHTDLNHECCLHLGLTRKADSAACLLSLVLPFAAFFDQANALLEPPSDVWVALPRAAASVVQSSGLTVLGRERLEWELPFRRINGDEETSTVFQILFDEHAPRRL